MKRITFELLNFQFSILDILGAIIGLAFIVSEYRADRWFWPLSLLMSVFYAIIYFQAHYYANGGLCCYNFVMSIYGLLVWRGVVRKQLSPQSNNQAIKQSSNQASVPGGFPARTSSNQAIKQSSNQSSVPGGFPARTSSNQAIKQSSNQAIKPITSCPRKYWLWIIIAVALFTVLLAQLLVALKESHQPWLDGLTSAISIVGMYMVSQKWWQQWFCWVIVNPIMVYLFFASGNYASSLLYVVFSIVSILGIIHWRKESTNN